ncbi:hypothetical protein GCM10017744_103300 [Streptomyces antimycoticus]|uniref:Uncharacterized protein n=1 Tax=Streptomyces antimycoticus TaxID=68175 RepID=A0A4D4KME3_9ACTN|nr:hypothetical protein [Streptomyces antimycoticus]GDY49364.1 hypothetical protein SANT12839_102460 [Streptomyces antimycoticus]
MHITVDDFAAAQAATLHQAQGLARTIADTLTAMYPTAAYLALERDGDDRDRLWLHSIRDITGRILWDTASSSPLPALADAELRQAWGRMDPCVPSNLGGLINSLAAVGALFDFLPDAAAHEDDPKDPDPDLLCLTLSDQAEPGLWWWDGDALLRPYSAPRPATPHN